MTGLAVDSHTRVQGVYLLQACERPSSSYYVILVYTGYIYYRRVTGLAVVTTSYSCTGGIFTTGM